MAALTGDFGVRERVDSRPGATFGLMENRFLLWTAAEALVPSPFWSLPSPEGVGFSDGATKDLFSVSAVLFSLTSLGVSPAS